jgi:hypothetical protein
MLLSGVTNSQSNRLLPRFGSDPNSQQVKRFFAGVVLAGAASALPVGVLLNVAPDQVRASLPWPLRLPAELVMFPTQIISPQIPRDAKTPTDYAVPVALNLGVAAALRHSLKGLGNHLVLSALQSSKKQEEKTSA